MYWHVLVVDLKAQVLDAGIAKGIVILREDGRELGGEGANVVCMLLIDDLEIDGDQWRCVHGGDRRDRSKGIAEANPSARQGYEVTAENQLMPQVQYDEEAKFELSLAKGDSSTDRAEDRDRATVDGNKVLMLATRSEA